MFDPDKPVVTRDGRPARIVATNLKGRYPLAAVVEEGGNDTIYRYTPRGSFTGVPGETALDLLNVPEEPREAFFNVYLKDRHFIGPKLTLEEADDHAGPDRSFTVRVLFEDETVTAVELA